MKHYAAQKKKMYAKVLGKKVKIRPCRKRRVRGQTQTEGLGREGGGGVDTRGCMR